MVENGCSVTCEVRAGETRWWLTRESGRLPLKCKAEGCARCSWGPGTTVVRASYVVIRVVQSSVVRVCFALLSAERVGLVSSTVVPCLLGVRLKDRVMVRLDEGAFSLSRECTCAGCSKVCIACAAQWCVSGSAWRRSDTYAGLWPKGRGDWFTGVSDGVGSVKPGRRCWLSCDNAVAA